jgi:dipeptidyl aminopeptidase/acylaminoacyl peptidase
MKRLLLLVLASTVLPASAQKRPMTTDDGLRMHDLSSALMTPDGSGVLYGVSDLDWDENKRETTYFRIPADSGEAYPYLGKEGGSDLKFSPDGRFLSFKRTVDKKAQLFVLRTQGGEARQLTKHDEAVGSYAWLPGSDALVFVAEWPRGKDEQKEFEKGDDGIFVDEGPNGQTASRWQSLYRVALPEGKIRQLTRDSLRIGAPAVAPDGRSVAVTVRRENRRNDQWMSEIHRFTFADSSLARLTRNGAPEGSLEWAPDSRRLAFTAPDTADWDLRNDKIWILDTSSGGIRMASGGFTGNIGTYAFTPDGGSILFNGLHRTNRNLYRLALDTGEVTALTDVVGSLDVQDFSKDRTRMVYQYSSFSVAPDLYTSPTVALAPRRLTDLNPIVRDSLILARAETVRWTSSDGLEIEGLLLTPPGAATPMPLLLHIHGGPAGVFTNRFSFREHVWAGLGYLQLMPNVRGSSGYDDALLRGNMRDIGGGDFQDLMTGVDHLVADGLADSTRLAVRGWSYGGILGGWTITQTHRFRAASVGAMVSDWTSEYGPGFNHDVTRWYIGGTPWSNPEEWRHRSALTHAANVTTPTLILHGIADPTDTEPQSMSFFAALKDLGKAVRYIRFPRELHGFREPRHQRMRDVEEIRWIHEHVTGSPWTAWPAPKSTADREGKDGKDGKDGKESS